MQQLPSGATKQSRFGCGIAIALALLVVIALLSVGPYTEYLWYAEDAGYSRIFSLQYEVRSLLFLIAFPVTWAAIYFGWRQALQFKFVYVEVPEGPVRQVTAVVMLVQRYGHEVLRFLAPLAGIMAGLSLSAEWQTMLFAQHAHSFGRRDPVFGWDYSFFVFHLPWIEARLNAVTAIVLAIALVHGAAAGGLKAIQRFAPVESNLPRVIGRACGWLGVALIILGIRIGAACFEYGTREGSQFVGAGFATVLQLKATALLAGMVVLLGIVVMIARSLTVAWKAAIPCGAVLILGVWVLPAIVQSIHVEPDKNRVEAPFAQRAIDSTRYAYNLDGIDVREMPTHDEPTHDEIATAKGTFDNMRLWDPAVLQEAIEQLQSFKQYYTFNDVDIDRYLLPGEDGKLREQMVMLSPRDISLPGLGGSSQTWVNTKLVYTHGYGVVVAPVNEANSLGQPVPIVKDLPVTGPPQLALDYPQIYFSDFRSSNGDYTDSYSIVNTRVDEFDYPTQTGDAFHRWTGTSGIRIDGLATRIAFSVALGDWTLLVTNNLKPGSRLILHRSVVDRARRLYPFLEFDRDPYIVILKGHVVWVLDGYTTTDRVPYSAMVSFGERDANYVRNSVKVTVDAYSGHMTAYEVDPAEPILQAYEEIYPGLIHPAGEISPDLRAHFRYPEDLFTAQSAVLCTYHVTDPQQFLSNVDAWLIPNERGLNGQDKEPSRPYFIQMRLPDGKADEFVLMRGFTPYTRDNLSGWLAGHCDGDAYGKLTMYLFSKGATVPGPWQVENLFVQDPRVADVNRQFNNDQSRIVVGNLLVVPVGSSIVYAESLFLRGSSAVRGIPELRRVILAVKNRIEMGDTYADALAKLFSKQPPDLHFDQQPQSAVGTTQPVVPMTDRSKLEAVAKLLDDADAALRRGDFAKYGELQAKARTQVHELAGGHSAK